MDWSEHTVSCTLLCLFLGLICVDLRSYAVTVVTGNEHFTIQHEGTGRCLQVQDSTLILANCSADPSFLWKWGSNHRLFHTGSSACLGMDVPSKTLSLTSCSVGTELEWLCYEGFIYTVYQMRLGVSPEGNVLAKRDATDSWSRGGTSENICEQPYQMMHTSDGNSNGAPCKFPFLYNSTWHHGCLPSDDTHPLDWCSTTDNYDQDQKWGSCLKYEEGCGALWNLSSNGLCYQVVPTAMVTWHEARDACRSQGGDLLGVSSSEELRVFKAGTDLPEKLWIGLNHLDWVQGWQWSDGSSLAYIPWDTESRKPVALLSLDCGVMHPNMRFTGEICEKKLPYICKKKENSSQTEAAGKVVYKPTECDSGWVPAQGHCYKLYGTGRKTGKNYADAQQTCVQDGAQLASIHSLGDIEMLSNEYRANWAGWIGLKALRNTDLYKWEDGTDMSFTYWGQTQPPLPTRNMDTCVSTVDANHVWFASLCNESRPFLCKKNGTVNESAAEDGCPRDADWRRHGNACYKVDTKEISYKNSCKITINNRFEQMFIDSLLKEHISSKPLYFWTGLQDTKGTGEYQWFSSTGQGDRVTYTNWKWQEPANGGCAVMSTASPLGKWSVKNCTVFKAGNICKMPTSSAPPVPTPAEIDVNAPCSKGWDSSPGIKYCYKIFQVERVSRKRSWEEAEQFCKALGAHLPSFTEEEEMKALHMHMRNSISDDRFFWVGLNRRNPNNDGSWEWSDGRPVSMSVFSQEFHEDDDYNRDCAAFKTLKGSFKLLFFFLLHDVPIRPFYSSTFHCDAQLEWVCQIPRGQTPKNPEWYNPDGYHNSSVFMDDQEFWFVNDPKLSYEEAEMYCSSNHSKLATPLTINAARHLQEHLFKNAGSQTANWWLDLRQPGPLIPVRYSRRHMYHSEFLGRCTSLSSASFVPDYRINCEEKLPFVCETLNITSAETGALVPHPPGKPCEAGTVAFRDKCYTVIEPKVMNFKAASDLCNTHRGTLLSIKDQAEQDFITTLLTGKPRKLWIGLKLRLHDTQWVDNTPITYLNFNPLLHGQLRPMYINTFEPGGLELCAYMLNDAHPDMLGTWDYTTCSDDQSVAICQHYADKPKAFAVSEAEFQVNNHTFKIVQKNMTWLDARDLCKSNKMELASISDAYVQAVLTVNVNKAGFPLWIGLKMDVEKHYQWIDGSHTVFSRWGQEDTEGPCVYLDVNGFWKATDCGEQLGGAICHIPHEDVQPIPEAGKCPHKNNGANWIPFKNNCYAFLLASVRWQEHDKNNDAQTCQAIAGMGDVLTIRNEEENEFIRKQLQPFKSLAKFVWLGMYKDKTDNHLQWFDKTHVQYSNWPNGRQNVSQTQSFMAGMNLDGRWELVQSVNLFTPFKQNAIVVCKLERDSKDEFAKSPHDVQAPSGYQFRLIAKRLNWYQALEECKSDNGHLVSIHNETSNIDMALISKRDGFPLWIGLSRQDFSGWPYEWSDGTQLYYQPQGFEVMTPGSEEKCVYVDAKGSWAAVNCHAELEGAICYTSQNRSVISAQSSNSCPESDGKASWLQFENHCYAIDMTHYNYSVYTMEDAKSVCKKLDPSSELLTIKSKEENDFVSRHVSEDALVTSRVWLGLTSADAKDWMDGSALHYVNWGHGHPQRGCAVLVSINATWSSASCTESRSRVVCKRPTKSGGAPVALAFFIILLFCLAAMVIFILYKRNRHRFFSTVRYQRNFDEADSTSIISGAE